MSDSESLLGSIHESVIPMDIIWKNLSVIDNSEENQVKVLKSISGHALHGEILVIMGQSKAGKASLLKILSNTLKPNENYSVTGDVFLNNHPISAVPYSNHIAFVPQDIFLLDCLTVYESLMFVINLRSNYPEKREKCVDIISQLKLENCYNQVVSGPYFKGISLGEKKRLAIAIEIINEPSLLFLEEPETGLDRNSALILFKTLISQANTGKNVILTMSSPTSEVYNLFDKLLLLCDGNIIYHGYAKDCVDYFKEIGFICSKNFNPADFFYDAFRIKDEKNIEKNEENMVNVLKEQYLREKDDEDIYVSSLIDLGTENYRKKVYVQIYYLFIRNFFRGYRNAYISFVKFFALGLFGLMMDTCYWDLGTEGEKSVLNRNGFLFFSVIGLIIISAISNILTFSSRKPIIYSEISSKTYDILPYYISLFLYDIVSDILVSMVYFCIVYWAVDLNTEDNWTMIEYLIIIFIITTSGSALGMMSSSLTSTSKSSFVLFFIFLMPFIFLSGFFRPRNLPDSIKWAKWFSPCYYGFKALLKNQYDDLQINGCCQETDCFRCDALDFYDADTQVYKSIATLGTIIFTFRVFTFLFIYLFWYQKRN